jgi:uncharacterized DUF497 family protein
VDADRAEQSVELAARALSRLDLRDGHWEGRRCARPDQVSVALGQSADGGHVTTVNGATDGHRRPGRDQRRTHDRRRVGEGPQLGRGSVQTGFQVVRHRDLDKRLAGAYLASGHVLPLAGTPVGRYLLIQDRGAMPFLLFQWDGENEDHLAEHGVTRDEFAEVVCDPDHVETSRTSGRPIAFGYTSTGKYLACVYELLDETTVYAITAFEPEE